MLLIVVEDRQAEAALQAAIGSARAGGAAFAVLTADALLMMRLARDGIDARLTLHAFTGTPDRRADVGEAAAAIDEGDRAALAGAAAAPGAYARFDGTDFARYFEIHADPVVRPRRAQRDRGAARRRVGGRRASAARRRRRARAGGAARGRAARDSG